MVFFGVFGFNFDIDIIDIRRYLFDEKDAFYQKIEEIKSEYVS